MAHKINISKKIPFRVWNCTGLQLKMSPPKQVTTTLVLCFAIVIPNVVVSQHQPYFFDYHQQQQPQYQQNPYQPFTNAPPGNYYTPTYESHSPGGGGHHAGSPELLGNYFSNGFSPAPTSPASNNLVTYPTQVTTLDGSRHHLSHQPYQPVGNSLVQQTPTVPTTTTTNAFRPSPLINHHTHIVNGLPQRQFFGNNYEFFRDRHGLPTFSPFTHQNTLQTVPSPSPTPALVSTSAAPSPSSASPSASPSKASESKQSGAVKPLPLDLPSSPSPPTTQSTFLSRFPFNGPSTFSPVNGGPGLGPVVGPDGFPAPFLGPGIPFSAGPGGALGPVPPGAHLPGGPVFRVGPRGRLLRRKTRPRAQLQGQQPSLAPSEAPSASPSLAPTPSSPSAFPEIASVAPNFVSSGPSQLPPLSPYNPNPFIPQEVPLVTTFRPGAQNVLLQQSLVDQEEERKQERPSTFRSRFRFQPSTTTSTAVEDEEEGEGASNQYESEEEAPVSQRRRFSTTSTTTEKPVEKAVISDRANILQRQIRFNRNRKNQKNNRES